MAPPIPGLRQPVQIRRRSPGDVLAGVGAIVLLTALTVGVPIALITVVGLPLPHSLPKLSALTSQLDITAILRILSELGAACDCGAWAAVSPAGVTGIAGVTWAGVS